MKDNFREKRNIFHKLLHTISRPVAVFILLQVVWVMVLFLWIFSFNKIFSKMGLNPDISTLNILMVTVGCVLLVLILVGTVMLFVFTQKQASFLRRQKNFVSSVTHELKSPLASLQLSFETLQNPKLPENVESRINEMVYQDIARLNHLVDRILVSARIEQGVYEIENTRENNNIKILVTNLIRQAGHLDDNLESRISLDIDSDVSSPLPKLALSIIVGNLLENAIKYSLPNTPINISAKKFKESMSLTISDQGYGLTSKDLKKIFKMFYRADLASKKAIKGTGLGLYISKSTAKLLKGDIQVKSEGLGKGTQFVVNLPG